MVEEPTGDPIFVHEENNRIQRIQTPLEESISLQEIHRYLIKEFPSAHATPSLARMQELETHMRTMSENFDNLACENKALHNSSQRADRQRSASKLFGNLCKVNFLF